MEIIKRHKKVFIIIVILAALIAGVFGLSLMAFNAGTTITLTTTSEEKTEQIIHEPRTVQQDTKYNELDFSNGPVVFNKTVEHNDGYATGGGDIMTAYLHKGDTIEFSYKSKIKKGDVGYNLLSKYGEQYKGIIYGSTSSVDTTVIEEDGNYIFEYSMNDFRGNIEFEVIVTRTE